MSGLLAAIKLREASYEFTVFEKADRAGGTWRENTYPGFPNFFMLNGSNRPVGNSSLIRTAEIPSLWPFPFARFTDEMEKPRFEDYSIV